MRIGRHSLPFLREKAEEKAEDPLKIAKNRIYNILKGKMTSITFSLNDEYYVSIFYSSFLKEVKFVDKKFIASEYSVDEYSSPEILCLFADNYEEIIEKTKMKVSERVTEEEKAIREREVCLNKLSKKLEELSDD